MTSIYDIPIYDIKLFLIENRIGSPKDENKAYDEAFKLMGKLNTSFNNVPISISEWILAHNVITKNTDVPTYSLNDLEEMNNQELSRLSKLLGMKSTNLKNIINILRYAGKLDEEKLDKIFRFQQN